MIYGYARISTNKQSIDRQIRNIVNAEPSAKIIEEVYTGTSIVRPKFEALLKHVKSGDTIVFDSVSRMSRCADEGFKAYKALFESGVELRFLKEPHINTAVYRSALQAAIPMTGTAVDSILQGVNDYLMHLAAEQIRIAFEQSQKEVDDMRQRTREGIETARSNGKQIGQQSGRKLNVKKAAAAKEVIRLHSADFCGTLNDIDTMKLCGVSRNTYYKYKSELRGELCAVTNERD